MKDKRSFLDRLLGRTQKEVLIRDENDRVSGKTTYHYDSYGRVVKKDDAVWDRLHNEFRTTKEKFWARQANGMYAHDKTFYYDDDKRLTTERYYNYDSKDFSFECVENQYAYPRGEKTMILHRESDLSAVVGWRARYEDVREVDDQGYTICEINRKRSDKTGTMVCIREQNMIRKDGKIDPLETIYRDDYGRITTMENYYRQKTEGFDQAPLFCQKTSFSYDKQGVQHIDKQSKAFQAGFSRWLDASILEGDKKTVSERLAKATRPIEPPEFLSNPPKADLSQTSVARRALKKDQGR